MPSISDALKSAANPQAALLIIGEALDQILARLEELDLPSDEWGEWPSDEEAWGLEPKGRAYDAEVVGEGEVVITIRPATPEKQERRRLFAENVLNLGEQGLPLDDPSDIYAKGGPLWLYHGNREMFMSYAPEVRQAMVMDIEEDDPQTAIEVGRDVLKDAEGVTRQFAEEVSLDSVS